MPDNKEIMPSTWATWRWPISTQATWFVDLVAGEYTGHLEVDTGVSSLQELSDPHGSLRIEYSHILGIGAWMEPKKIVGIYNCL